MCKISFSELFFRLAQHSLTALGDLVMWNKMPGKQPLLAVAAAIAVLFQYLILCKANDNISTHGVAKSHAKVTE